MATFSIAAAPAISSAALERISCAITVAAHLGTRRLPAHHKLIAGWLARARRLRTAAWDNPSIRKAAITTIPGAGLRYFGCTFSPLAHGAFDHANLAHAAGEATAPGAASSVAKPESQALAFDTYKYRTTYLFDLLIELSPLITSFHVLFTFTRSKCDPDRTVILI